MVTEIRLGLDLSMITRFYYIIIPNQVVLQSQIQEQLNVGSFSLIFSSFSHVNVRFYFSLYFQQ